MLAQLISELSVQDAIVDHLRILGWYVCHMLAGGPMVGHLMKMHRQYYVAGFPDL